MKETLSGRVYAILPTTGSMTAPEISKVMKRSLQEVTSLLRHLEHRYCVVRVKRNDDDPRKIRCRWSRGPIPYTSLARIRTIEPKMPVEPWSAELLVKHWPAGA